MNETVEVGCEEALRQLLTHLDGELPDADSRRVDEHLRKCRSCWSRAEFERRLKGELAELRSEPVRPEFENLIRSLISGIESEGG
jgi:anti-sigma factor RsiW